MYDDDIVAWLSVIDRWVTLHSFGLRMAQNLGCGRVSNGELADYIASKGAASAVDTCITAGQVGTENLIWIFMYHFHSKH